MSAVLLGEAGTAGRGQAGSHLGRGTSALPSASTLARQTEACLTFSHPPGRAGQAGPGFRRSNRFRVKSCAQATLTLDEAVETGGTARGTGQRNQETRSHTAPRARLSQTALSCHFPVCRMRTATYLVSCRTV